MSDALVIAVSFLLVFLAVLAIICAWELLRLSRIDPPIGAAIDRAHAAVTSAIGATIGGLLGLNFILRWRWDQLVWIGLLSAALLTVSIPSVLWLARYRRDLLLRGMIVAALAAAVIAAALLFDTTPR